MNNAGIRLKKPLSGTDMADFSAVLEAHLTSAVALSQLSGIRVNAIAPGWVETPMLHEALDNDPQRKDRILSRTPLCRFGASEDIGSAAVYLSSPAGSFVSGVVLPVDGGALIGF